MQDESQAPASTLDYILAAIGNPGFPMEDVLIVEGAIADRKATLRKLLGLPAESAAPAHRVRRTKAQIEADEAAKASQAPRIVGAAE